MLEESAKSGDDGPEKALSTEGLELVTDGYYRHNDIAFKYLRKLDRQHANAIGPLLRIDALVHPDHPLRSPGDEGITLYIGIDKFGKPRLLWKIQQLQYLQYYIHEMRLTTPSWIEYHRKRQDLGQEKAGQEADEELPHPPLEEGKDDWVPLPRYPIRARDLVSITPMTFNNAYVLRKMAALLVREGKSVVRDIKNALEAKTYDRNYWEAKKDDFTPGPGLRKGPERQGRSDAARGRLEDENDGTGWGGFPLKDATRASGQDNAEGKSSSNSFFTYQTQSGVESIQQNPGVSSTPAAVSEDALASPSSQSGISTPFDEIGTSYYLHCQEAFTTAISGGLLASMPASQQPSHHEDEEEVSPMDIPPNIGRSLFIALCVTKWEKNPRIVTEIGWSAIWWQEAIPGSQVSGGYEEMTECGHYIVQEHLIDKRNKDTQPDYKDDFLYGESLPISEGKIREVIKRQIQDLSAKAGKGPIYIVTHTPEGEEMDWKSIGLDVSSTAINQQPDGWDVPPYLCAAGCGSVFVINTATLFGSIENVPYNSIDGVKYAGRTKRSLQNTALVMCGDNPDKKPEKCGNAGNDAVYTLAIFVEMMTSPPLPELREDYASGHFPRPRVVDTQQDHQNSADHDLADDLESCDQELSARVDATHEEYDYDDDEDFLEDEMIKGIFYEDEEGNIVELIE
ncbi:uncharacterized protein I303_101679 [Kwoniella dejecticola CBS 10117]|uniref:Gfd2/YDR514C-like C-terminal domain-containing protein n=1 Tax=Kwoniella dejecticola CBS 10117 TaxID=1296121 RepID=A0A1A6AD39_9TREE|nr:uncharacterized protein I303_02185 [Kwoniella dejecticola CBS 10117]OBR87969.1 hypothetical protein I303_02185 [Kwoniella dejecticola CBS 10117]